MFFLPPIPPNSVPLPPLHHFSSQVSPTRATCRCAFPSHLTPAILHLKGFRGRVGQLWHLLPLPLPLFSIPISCPFLFFLSLVPLPPPLPPHLPPLGILIEVAVTTHTSIFHTVVLRRSSCPGRNLLRWKQEESVQILL